MSACFGLTKAYQSFSENADDLTTDERIVVTPHGAWGLFPSQRWPLGGNGIYCKAKLGGRKAKTMGVEGPDPTWDTPLVLPYDGERTVQLMVSCHHRGRPNEVLGACSLSISAILAGGPGPYTTDLTLRNGPQSTTAGVLSVTARLETPASASGSAAGAAVPSPPRRGGSTPSAGPTTPSRPSSGGARVSYPPVPPSGAHVVAGEGQRLVFQNTPPTVHVVDLTPRSSCSDEERKIDPSSCETPTDAQSEERRQLALEAATRRQEASEARGIGDPSRAQALKDRAMREQILGRIQDRCAILREEPPMGLNLATFEQLQATLQRLELPRDQR